VHLSCQHTDFVSLDAAHQPTNIASALAISGTTSAALKLLVMPHLLQRYDARRLYLICMGVWPLTFILFPLLSAIAWRTKSTGALLWAGVALVAVMSQIACLAFSYVLMVSPGLQGFDWKQCSISMILVRESAPSPSSLGAANGLAEVTQSLAMAVSPFIVRYASRLLRS
jgi:hypothetical protein